MRVPGVASSARRCGSSVGPSKEEGQKKNLRFPRTHARTQTGPFGNANEPGGQRNHVASGRTLAQRRLGGLDCPGHKGLEQGNNARAGGKCQRQAGGTLIGRWEWRIINAGNEQTSRVSVGVCAVPYPSIHPSNVVLAPVSQCNQNKSSRLLVRYLPARMGTRNSPYRPN